MAEGEFRYYDFFAGGGMARTGLGEKWRCLFANDICGKKANSYRRNFGSSPEYVCMDVRSVSLDMLPGTPRLVWASFPCQDLSLAGSGGGLRAERSGAFWPFWNLVEGLAAEKREPDIAVLENVTGAITSHGGRDFRAILEAVASLGYLAGPLIVDAVHFVPQSRPRLFIVAVKKTIPIPDELMADAPSRIWCSNRLKAACDELEPSLKKSCVWWRMPPPKKRRRTLSSIVEDDPREVQWHTREETDYLLSLMSPVNLRKVRDAQALETRIAGTVYKRMRLDRQGAKVQRAEVRFDQISGCLRTPTGGSSRQTLLIVEGRKIRSRLLSNREAARLMGLPDKYKLPDNYNEGYHLLGDGVAVPVVRHLAEHILEPILIAAQREAQQAA